MVISSEDGIFFKLTGDGDRLAQLWDQPTAIAFMIGDDLVAAQRASSGDVYPPFADGPIVVFDPSGRRDLDRGEERLVLLDTGVVDGHPVALATSETGSGPEDTDERLLLIGLPSGERTDLGSVAGWESTVVQARLTPQGVVLLIDGEGRRSLIARSLDGNVQWELPLSDQVVTLKDSELILVLPGFTGGSFTPVVTLARHDVSTGSELGAQEMTLRPALDYRIQGGFCFTADWIDETLVCDQTYGAPLLIEPSGDVSLVNGVDGGVATVVRRHSSSSG